MKFNVKVDGLNKVSNNLLALAKRERRLAAQALNEIGEHVMGEAKSITPVKDGRLKRSGKVSQMAQPHNLEAVLTYGTDYALFVHEIPPPPRRSEGGRSARHQPPYGTGGEWKFLEKPVNKEAKTFELDVAKIIRQGMAQQGRMR
jgi:hypothetical protein